MQVSSKALPPFVFKSRVFRLFGFARAAKRADTKSPFRFSGIAARSAFTGQHAGNSGLAAAPPLCGPGAEIPALRHSPIFGM